MYVIHKEFTSLQQKCVGNLQNGELKYNPATWGSHKFGIIPSICFDANIHKEFPVCSREICRKLTNWGTKSFITSIWQIYQTSNLGKYYDSFKKTSTSRIPQFAGGKYFGKLQNGELSLKIKILQPGEAPNYFASNLGKCKHHF